MRPARPDRSTRLARQARCLLLGLVTAWAALPAAATGGDANAGTDDCALLWQVTARLDAQPRQLLVSLRFDGGARSRTTLRLPGGWAGLQEQTDASGDSAPDGPRLRPVPGAPALRTVAHALGERVRLHWRLTPAADAERGGGAQTAERWFAFSGPGVLPVPDELDERAPPTACIRLDGLPEGSRWASSHGNADGASVLWRVAPAAAPLAVRVQQALYAGGALQWQTLASGGAALTAVMPAGAGWRFGVDALAQASAEALASQRRYWGELEPAPPWLVLLLPAPVAPAGGDTGGGTAWHRALALQASTDLPLPGAGVDALITQALARAWMVDRFGPLAHAGRGDEPLRDWFSEGWAEYLAHRSLLREGRWTPADYAAVLNRKIMAYLDNPERALPNVQVAEGALMRPALAALPGARGEWLALQWHAALRGAGQPGLDAVMRRLLVPAASARREGPISAPLATHRLVAALRAVLDDQPLRDINRFIERGETFAFGPTTLGPCFIGQTVRVPSWALGFDSGSLASQVVAGVQPGGPADAAGLRDGMRLLGHSLVPGDTTQAVRLQVQAADGSRQDISYLPAGEPVRELARYQSVAQAMQQPACLGWLGLGPLAGANVAPAAKAGGHTARHAQTAGKGSRKATGKAAAKPSGKSGTKPATKSTNKSATQPVGKAAGQAAAPPRQR